MIKTNNNKIIFLVAPPRSLSTAFLRMMEARGDFKIFNEPATCLFNKTHYPNSEVFYIKKPQETYNDIEEKLYKSQRDNHVFVKEMSFAFYEFISHGQALLSDKNVYFVFLLRNPHHCIISYYNKIPAQYLDFMVSDLDNLTAYKALYKSYETIKKNTVNKAFVLHAEQLIDDTASTVQAFCKWINIPYKDDSLIWDSLGNNFTGQQEWQENKKVESTYHWHQEAILSRGFHQPTHYETDENNYPSFSEIENVDHKKICMQVYRNYLSYYQLIAGH